MACSSNGMLAGPSAVTSRVVNRHAIGALPHLTSGNPQTCRVPAAASVCASSSGASCAAFQGVDVQVFTKRLDTTVLAGRARRTGRLEELVHHLGSELGGRPGAGFAQGLMLPVSNDTLLHVVRRRARPRTEPLAVVGIDHWAKLAKVPATQSLE